MDNPNMDIAELIRKASILDGLILSGDVSEEVLQIEDFSQTLATTIKEQLDWMDEPTFLNPTTGKVAASVFAILEALDFSSLDRWRKVSRVGRKAGVSFFTRRDLPKKSPHPTPCLDLEMVEGVILKSFPRKGSKVVGAFKDGKGLI